MVFKSILWAVCICLAVVSFNINAALIDRGNGLIYDVDRGFTWLADANYAMTSGYDADGRMGWWGAGIWAGQLVYEGFDNWRLPSGDSCVVHNCNNSEMGHLFYNELGGVAGSSILASSDSDIALFINIQSYMYWSSYELPHAVDDASYFATLDGSQGGDNKYKYKYAWAVHDGDIGAVPIPATVWLFGSGLLVFVGVARRKVQT